jgi:hypothetical protein
MPLVDPLRKWSALGASARGSERDLVSSNASKQTHHPVKESSLG